MRGFFGGLLVATGLLLASTTGLCTGAVIFMALPGLIQQPGAMLSASPFLLIGILPCALGVFMVVKGRALLRERDPSSSGQPRQADQPIDPTE